MIKAQDLRVGNWLKTFIHRPAGSYIQVDSISANGVNLQSSLHGIDYDFFSDYEPIPLTPEILEKCGFEKDDESNFGGFVSPYVNDEAIRIRKDEISFYYSSHVASTPRRIQYLHQLQNLFYILSGEELEIKL